MRYPGNTQPQAAQAPEPTIQETLDSVQKPCIPVTIQDGNPIQVQQLCLPNHPAVVTVVQVKEVKEEKKTGSKLSWCSRGIAAAFTCGVLFGVLLSAAVVYGLILPKYAGVNCPCSLSPTMSPTPSPTRNPASSPASSQTSGGFDLKCFSADSMVFARKRGSDTEQNMKLKDIEIGDAVLSMNPMTNDVFWDEVLLNLHYKWYQGSNIDASMRTLYLGGANYSNDDMASITLTRDHFVYIKDVKSAEPKVIRSQLVEVGDMLYYYDDFTNQSEILPVIYINESVVSKPRAFFTTSPYVLVNNVVASPYTGHKAIHHTILHQLYIHLIFLRYFINEDILVFLACFGYYVILHPLLFFGVSIFCIFSFCTLSPKQKFT